MISCSAELNSQAAVVAFLSDPASYGIGVDRVEVIETHISLVFLVGDRAYKLKRAVKLPYLDFSTEAQRRLACEAEIRLNRRTAPDLYLETRPLSVKTDGNIVWGKAGHVIDWIVVMRRFEQHSLLDSLAALGMLSPRLMLDVVDHIVGFHARAERLFDRGGSEGIARIEQKNLECLNQNAGNLFRSEDIGDLHNRSMAHFARISAHLDERRAAGKVRHCHGDLHLRNICLLDGKPVLFDCIEFSDELASIDILYDFAFLLMDLEHRHLQDLANQAFNRYLDLTEEDDGLPALPLFVSLRAAVRAHVTATIASGAEPKEIGYKSDEARAYLDLARAVLQPHSPRLIAVGGLSGVGKSTIARALAPAVGRHPGARVLRSDVVRKRLWGVLPESALPPAAYAPELSRRVYDAIRNNAATALQAGYSVIIDAVSLREDERSSFSAVAAAATVPFCGIWLQAPVPTMMARLLARRHDASDATPEVLRHQLKHDPGRLDWQRIDVGGGRKASLNAVRSVLGDPLMQAR